MSPETSHRWVPAAERSWSRRSGVVTSCVDRITAPALLMRGKAPFM